MSGKSQEFGGNRLKPFHTTCWVLAIVAFLQIFGLGVAVALRMDRDAAPRVVEKIVTISAPAPVVPIPESEPAALPRARTPDELLAAIPEPVLPPLTLAPLTPEKSLPAFFERSDEGLPIVADPLVEKLIFDGRDLLVSGDVIRAMLKLQEALAQSPKDAQALYFLGESFEQIGQYSEAGDYYEKVYSLGSDAGVLYKRSARKLAEGFNEAELMQGKMRIGQIKKFTEDDDVALTIPIMSAARVSIIPEDVSVNAQVFVKDQKGEIRILNQTDKAKVTHQFLSNDVDWLTGEETLRVNYTRPNVPGESEFYGYVVTLSYENEALDLLAWPRLLAQKLGRQDANAPLELPNFDELPGFFDALNLDNPLLPRKN